MQPALRVLLEAEGHDREFGGLGEDLPGDAGIRATAGWVWSTVVPREMRPVADQSARAPFPRSTCA